MNIWIIIYIHVHVAKNKWVTNIDEKFIHHNVVHTLVKYTCMYLINCLEDRLECCKTEHESLNYINNIVKVTGNIIILVCTKCKRSFWFTKNVFYIIKIRMLL